MINRIVLKKEEGNLGKLLLGYFINTPFPQGPIQIVSAFLS